MSSYSSEIWQEGFCKDSQFPRGGDAGFYQEEMAGYLSKSVQNGGPHQFGSTRCVLMGSHRAVFIATNRGGHMSTVTKNLGHSCYLGLFKKDNLLLCWLAKIIIL